MTVKTEAPLRTLLNCISICPCHRPRGDNATLKFHVHRYHECIHKIRLNLVKMLTFGCILPIKMAIACDFN